MTGVRICALLLYPVTPGLSTKILAEFGLEVEGSSIAYIFVVVFTSFHVFSWFSRGFVAKMHRFCEEVRSPGRTRNGDGMRHSDCNFCNLLGVDGVSSLRIPGLARNSDTLKSSSVLSFLTYFDLANVSKRPKIFQVGSKPKPLFQRIDLEPWKGK